MRAGVTRTSVPFSHGGTVPVTGTESRWSSSSWVLKPTERDVFSIVHIGPSRLDHVSTDVNLTPTSAIVLGLLELTGEATPYDLKQAGGNTVGPFWTLQPERQYTEPD